VSRLIGMALAAAPNRFQRDRMALVPFAIIAVVIIAEVAVTCIRKHVI
jgi:hypothetical protein